MGKSQFWFNSREDRWEIRGNDGKQIAYFPPDGLVVPEGKTGTISALDVGSLADLQGVKIGGEDTITWFNKHIGTLTGIAAIGSGGVALGTITGVASLAVAAGDVVFGCPKADRSAGHVNLQGFYVPTTNVINAYLQNSKSDSAGSYPSTGIDLFIVRA